MTTTSSLPPGQKELRSQLRKLIRLVEISLRLNSTIDPEQLLQSIIESATELLECEAASVLLYDETTQKLHFAAATGTDPKKLAEISVPKDRSIAGVVFRENRVVLVADVHDDPRHYDFVSEQVHFAPRSLLGVPMRIRDNVTGVLEALNKNDGFFDKEDADILAIIANQAAVAISNARQMQALQNAYAEIQRTDEMKTRFLALASHELRTPLQHILGYGSLLKQSTDDHVTESASKVVEAANHMKDIIDTMTNLELIRRGEMSSEFKQVSLQSILDKALQGKMGEIKKRGHQMEWLVPMQPITINADPEKLPTVFSAILDNAVRFTPDGGRITVQVERKKSYVEIQISDTGIGIPPIELENIFKEFYQVEQHLTRTYGGLGLGLSVARGVVTLHGGKIWATSDGENTGTTIFVQLPEGKLPTTGTLRRIVTPS
jgi:signal transduction histidine kinase